MINTPLIERIKTNFNTQFGTEPLLVFSPGRINLIGEHTDYNEGFVFPAAIDKGIVAAIDTSDTAFCTIVAADKNESIEFSLNKLQPIPNGSWRNYVLGVVDEVQKKGLQLSPFHLVFGGNIPSGAGLSSSAALENSIVFALNEFFSLRLSKKEMILISQKAEHHFVGVHCGIMDQYASMFGVQDKALLLDCRDLSAIEFTIDFKEYTLLLINTHVKHNLAESAYNDRRSTCEKITKLLHIKALRDANETDLLKIQDQVSTEDYQKAVYIIQENQRVLAASKALKNNNLTAFGKLLYSSHNGLQHQYDVSCTELDFLVDLTREFPEVLGARMMGGGFGGCTLNLIKKEAIEKFTNKASSEYLQKFGINISSYQLKIANGTHRIS
ncbi:MAG: galactokinase [Polaribacter sp.]|nr:galactokinase [Polaribacter sp.]